MENIRGKMMGRDRIQRDTDDECVTDEAVLEIMNKTTPCSKHINKIKRHHGLGLEISGTKMLSFLSW